MTESLHDQSVSRLETSFNRFPHSACIWPGIHGHQNRKNNNYDDSPGREIIIARRFKSVQNAANRARSNNISQFGFSQDDSILGPASNIDSTDGVVELRAQRLEMSFQIQDAFSLIFSMCSFFADLVTDIAVAIFHYLNYDYWYAALTATFVFVPTLLTTVTSLRWYVSDSKQDGSEHVGKLQWALRILFHICLVGPIIRYYESLQYGLRFRKEKDPVEKRNVYLKMIYEDADATMLRLFESFLESAPQLILQVYIITKNYPFDDYEYWTVILQVISISSSLISISWSLVSYSKSLRISLDNKIPMTYWSMGVMFLWEFLSMAARMIALALFTSAYVKYAGFVCLFHWACMTCWIVSMKTNFCSTKCEEFTFDSVLGVIFIFCYFNPVDNATRFRYMAFYAFMFCENSILLAFWYNKVTYVQWLKELVIVTHYSCFFSGLLVMIVYYRWFHPTGGIRWHQVKVEDQ